MKLLKKIFNEFKKLHVVTISFTLHATTNSLRNSINTETAKLRALRAHVPKCLACLRARVSTCLACLRAQVATYLACLRAHEPVCLTCLRALRAYMLKCQKALHANVLCVFLC